MNDTIGDDDLRKQALERIEKKRDFRNHLVAYILVNATLIVVWATVSGGFFWPMFPMLGWGIGLLFHALDVYGREPTEEQIQREMKHIHR